MGHIAYSFSDSDVETIIFALTVFPGLSVEDDKRQVIANFYRCNSAISKLRKHNLNISPSEFRVILASLQAVQLVNLGELVASQEVKKDCGNYLRAVNKLVPQLFGLYSS